jgi:hypothetical protein
MIMSISRSRRVVAWLAASGLAASGLAASGLLSAPASAAPAPGADLSVHGVPTVVARMTSKHIQLSVGNHMRAGRVMFKVVTRDKRNHDLQLLRLHRGYTAQQAQADFGKAFSGDVAAVRRIDANITFLGGAPAKVGKPGWFSVKLHANRYMVVDQNGPAMTALTVRGTAPKRPGVPHSSRILALSYGFDPSLTTMPASGWTLVGNHSDQPHFVVINRIKESTTRKMVHRYFKSGSQKPPPWGLRANTSTGVISPYKNETLHYDLPAGKYLLMCFWPDDDTGMPHAYMGMWRIVTLK